MNTDLFSAEVPIWEMLNVPPIHRTIYSLELGALLAGALFDPIACFSYDKRPHLMDMKETYSHPFVSSNSDKIQYGLAAVQGS